MTCRVVGGVIMCSRSTVDQNARAHSGYIGLIDRLRREKGVTVAAWSELLKTHTGTYVLRQWTIREASALIDALERLPDPQNPTLFDWKGN
jgi:hypothetical protein